MVNPDLNPIAENVEKGEKNKDLTKIWKNDIIYMERGKRRKKQRLDKNLEK